MKYVCLACGRSFPYLAAWYWHIVREHPESEPEWSRAMRLEGRRPRLWGVLEDARAAGIVAIIREKGDSNE
jgi:hypothetical protein